MLGLLIFAILFVDPDLTATSEASTVPTETIRFEQSSGFGCYYRMFQDGVEIDYPIGGSHNCGILTFDLDVDVFGSPGDYATVTVVKPDGQPLVMVDYLLPGGLDPIFGRNDLAVFNVESGTYILKVTSIGRADIEYPFTIEPDENLDMGSIVLTRLPAED